MEVVRRFVIAALLSFSGLGVLPAHSIAGVIDKSGSLRLVKVAGGFQQVTDIQAVPKTDRLAVAVKTGQLFWYDPGNEKRGQWLSLDVPTASEQGLLGIVFHPQFAANRQFVIHYSTEIKGKSVGQVALWQFTKNDKQDGFGRPEPVRVIMTVDQPYANHNAGQLAFGPDGYLYIAWGDGGWAGDPHDHGQNTKTFLGSLVRIDIDRTRGDLPYSIPKDNPFLENKDFLPEIWAWGFRNPWRYSFDSQGRLWIADVGQNEWEEISLVEKGNNYGWNIMEGNHCYKPKSGCDKKGLTLPVYEYGHDVGSSITGGYEYTADGIPWLKGSWVFGDFSSGKIWALDLASVGENKTPKVYYLGAHNLYLSTFGRDRKGRILVGDYQKGNIYRIEAK